MAWHPGTTFSLLTFHICLFCVYDSFGQNVNCWWNKVVSVGESVFIECQADPQLPMLKCDECRFDLETPERTVEAKLHKCARLDASFTARVELQTMQAIGCQLTCGSQKRANCTLKEGFPPPTCIIPFDDEDNIHCHWPWSHNPSNLISFQLHWEQEGKNRQSSFTSSNSDSIPRENYSAAALIKVWVTVSNSQTSVKSDFVTFSKLDIVQPMSPDNINHTFNPLEFSWEFLGDSDGGRQWECEVQYQKQCDPDWTEVEEYYDVNYVLDVPLPFTMYDFRVRCGFPSDQVRTVMSDWSSVYPVFTPAAAPEGKVDVWIDCGLNSNTSSCIIMWKAMPKTKARGEVNGYLVTVRLNNGSELTTQLNSSMCLHCGDVVNGTEPASFVSLKQKCHQEQDLHCFQELPSQVPLREVQGICVTANTSEGVSSPAFVPLPKEGAQIPEVSLKVEGVSEMLKVTWVSPDVSENVQEYVVQHKPLGQPHSPCLNWIKLENTKKSVALTGQFRNYTAYSVSLFAVINKCSQLLQSTVAYTVEGAPPKVSDVQVILDTPNSINLTWTPIPPDKSRGVILEYIVGFINQSDKVYRARHNSLVLSELNPGQQYEVWISAVTAAGEGERTTTKFTIDDSGNDVVIAVIIVVLFAVLLLLFLSLFAWMWTRPKVITLFFRVPDPLNSSLFQSIRAPSNQVKFPDSWFGPCISMECSPKISQIEVVMVKDSPPDVVAENEAELEQLEPEQHEEQLEEDWEQEEDRRKERRESEQSEGINSVLHDRRKDYSQMIDSTDEGGSVDDEEEDEWDMPYPSDYERHFWPPTAVSCVES